MIPVLALCGALIGLGAFLIIREVRPAPPNLAAGLARLDGHTAQDPGNSRGLRGIGVRVAARLAGPGGLPVPGRDLDLLGKTPQQFMLTKIGCLLTGLALPVIFSVLAGLGGVVVPLVVPAGAALGLGAALLFVPDVAIRVDAAKRRTEFRALLTSYLDFVAVERAAGAFPIQALESSAAISDDWVFRRIGGVLDRARRAQVPPWEGLAHLGTETGVSELADIADIAELAGNEGAAVLDTLMEKAQSMRLRALADAQEASNGKTTTMVIPVALLAFGFLILLAFPVVYRMAAT